MKKVPTDPRSQARRMRALDRFSINEARAKKDPEYKARKEQERNALLARLHLA